MGYDSTIRIYNKKTRQWEDSMEYYRRFCFYEVVGAHNPEAYNADGGKLIPLSKECVEEIKEKCRTLIRSGSPELKALLECDKDDALLFCRMACNYPPDQHDWYYDIR